MSDGGPRGLLLGEMHGTEGARQIKPTNPMAADRSKILGERVIGVSCCA